MRVLKATSQTTTSKMKKSRSNLLIFSFLFVLMGCSTHVTDICGGIRNVQCDDGYTCVIRGSDPEALGSCQLGKSAPIDNTTNVIGPGDIPENKFCLQDSDCVRQNSCCDCGVGEWVHKDYQVQVRCAKVCQCEISNTVGKCRSNQCVGVEKSY
jgi:hypothetical protein